MCQMCIPSCSKTYNNDFKYLKKGERGALSYHFRFKGFRLEFVLAPPLNLSLLIALY